MSFVFDEVERVIVDPENGDRLKQRRLHYQDQRWFQTIVSAEGKSTFEATFLTDADGSLADPDRPGAYVLLNADRYDAQGQTAKVLGDDADLDRILAYLRDQVGAGPFVFIDRR
jgi:hypothetical protein